MIDIPVEDFVFVVCALIGGGLLLITVLLDDILGAVFDFDVGGVSLMPLLLSFISMFGVGGLFATRCSTSTAGRRRWSASAFGLVGMGIAYGLFSALRRAEADEPFSMADLVGDTPSCRSAFRPVATAACWSRRKARRTSTAPRRRWT